MFQGTIPSDIQRMLGEAASRWGDVPTYVACSGKFTSERVLHASGVRRLVGNDVSLYTSTMGRWLAGQDHPLAIVEEFADEAAFMADSLATPIDRVATVLLASNFANGFLKPGAFHRRMIEGYRRQWPRLHAETVQRLAGVQLRLADFFCGDCLDYIQTVPDDAAVVTFPPFWAKGYENQFKGIETVFGWVPPTYQPLEEEGKLRLLEKAADRRHWFLMVHMELPAPWDQYLCGLTRSTNRGIPVWLYASKGAAVRVVQPRQDLEPVLVPRLQRGESIEAPLTLAQLTPAQFATLRSQYLNPRIRPGTATLMYAVLAAGKIVGCFAFNPPDPTTAYRNIDGPSAYLLSDFAVAPTDYPRLSKLVLMAALSTEAQALAQRAFNQRIRAVTTTAFAQRPVSMKYRGLFRLLKRDEVAEKDSTDGEKFKLGYGSPAGRWTLAEAYQLWRTKHASPPPFPTPLPSDA